MDQVSCLGLSVERSQLQQANVMIDLFNLVKDHRIHAWLTAICCCSLFVAHLRHSSAGSDILLGKSCQYSQRSEGVETTTHSSMVIARV